MAQRAPRLAGQRVLVVGLGRSGLAAARLCAEQGARVTVNDHRTAEALGAALAGLPPGIERVLGAHPTEAFLAADLIVVSPGVPALPALAAARAAGRPVTGELELASRFVAAPIAAVTGTNGKSTTTTLLGALLEATGRPVFAGGNLGTPLAEAVGTPALGPDGLCVVEVSSFQLETTETFRPRVGVLLNITPDHLDRHASLDEYTAYKARVFAAQRPDDFAIVNADDARCAAIGRGVRSQCLLFSTSGPLPEGTAGGWVERGVADRNIGSIGSKGANEAICLRLPGSASVERLPAALPGLLGRHNQENALAALLAARLLGLPAHAAPAPLHTFRALPHRMELVGTLTRDHDDVRFYDDSKGTNVGATVAALTGFPRPVVLIAGGKDKGGSYAPLAAALAGAGRAAVLIGEAAEKLHAALSPHLPVERASSLEAAVARAAALSRPGDAVVLSPACSSFDMFRDYAHRAEVFRAAVLGLPGVRPAGRLESPEQPGPRGRERRKGHG
jgi:UDP-N-acetylmuramoylalanine--D-glutamate ligase